MTGVLFDFMAVRGGLRGVPPLVTRGHGPGGRLPAGRQRRPCQIRDGDGGECRLTSRQVLTTWFTPSAAA
jgi:hypothetical protein